VGDALLDDLDPDQRAAVTSPQQPLAILAPAGSGKTRVLTRRIAFRIRERTCEARHVLALTFTRKAAGELVERLGRLGADGPVTAGTFHAVALRELRARAIERGHEPPRVLDRKIRLLAAVLDDKRGRAGIGPADLATEIEWAKARLVGPNEYAGAARIAGRRLPASPDAIAELFQRYESERRRRHLLDFDDLLRQCAGEMTRDPEFGAAQRWRFRHLHVDEFQDATPLQLALLRAWLDERPDLCAVGDPAQAIYAFAGADASPLRDFARHFPGGATIALTRNYRSAAPVVAIAEVALDVAGGERATPIAVRGAGDAPRIIAYDSDDDEATEVAALCRRAFTGGVPWDDIAILFRTNAQSARFESALTRRGIPFHMTDSGRFAARSDVRPFLDHLRTREREDPHSFAEHLAELATDDALAAGELRVQRDLILELGREYLAEERGASVAGFATWLDLATRADVAVEPGVTLATFHRAKGLEWPLVFVTGVERGLVPISWATSADARAEERRLLHVALSRAEEALHLSWARHRRLGTRHVTREPSAWLASLEVEAHRHEGHATDRYAHLAEVRATLATAAPPAPVPRRARRVRR
jgi:DNA helicase-2/ATP-dependent DNA helicase PcrA